MHACTPKFTCTHAQTHVHTLPRSPRHAALERGVGRDALKGAAGHGVGDLLPVPLSVQHDALLQLDLQQLGRVVRGEVTARLESAGATGCGKGLGR